MDIEISDHRSHDGSIGEYVLAVDGEPAGELNWSMRGERRAITHTGVRGQFRNKGLAALLMKRAMDDAASEAVTVVPLCSYAVDYLARTPGYEDSIG